MRFKSARDLFRLAAHIIAQDPYSITVFCFVLAVTKD